MNVEQWLRSLELQQYITAFRDNDIEAEVLARLTAEDLKEIGVRSVGHRRKLLDAIAELRDLSSSKSLENLREPTPSTQPVAAPTTGAERRQLTVMFVDLVGSTALATRLDPEEVRELLREFQNTVAGEVLRFKGHIAKLMGDGVLVYFGWPRAHEDEAERAVRTALAVLDAIKALPAKVGRQLSARIGIATGTVVVGDLIGIGTAQENAVVGETPNLAARLQAVAEPGTAVISELTYRLIGNLFEVTGIPPQQLHGFDSPVYAFRVIGESRVESRFEALHTGDAKPLAGREHEIALLIDRWRLAVSGEGQVVELFGEAGIGKSRLIQELRERLRDEAHTRLRYYCSPYHAETALFPVTDQLLRAGHIKRTDPPELQLDCLERLLSDSTADPEEALPLIAALLSIPCDSRYPSLDLVPQKQKMRTFEVLIEQLKALARQKPVLMLLEDAHHLDPTSAELFDQIASLIQRLPIMLVATSRPDGTVRWNGLPHATILPLNPLSRAQTTSIVVSMTGGKQLPEVVLDQILSKTEGVPLFVEELTKVVLESGLVLERDGELVLAGPLPPLAVPATLHDSLMARLDRLASVREVAQVGAVVGREFTHELLAAATGLSESELDRATERLVAAGLVFRRGGGNQASYAFKHALVQDAAYSTLLHSRRQHLHARIAAILEERPEVIATEPELLAHHFSHAGLVEKAVEYNELAGRRALSRSILAEALARFGNALSALSALPPSIWRSRRELAIQLALGSTHVAAHGFAAPSTAAAYIRARDLCAELGETRELFPVLYGLCLYHLYAAELTEARQATDRLLELAEANDDRGLSFFAHRAAGVSTFPTGEFSRAREHLEQALALYDPSEHRSPSFVYAFDPRVVCLDYLARTLLALGFPDQALATNGEAIAEAYRVGHRNSIALPLFFGGVIRQILGDREGVQDRCSELTEIASEAGFRFWLAGATILRAWTIAETGEIELGRSELLRGVDGWRATGAAFMIPYFKALEAQIEIRGGDYSAAYRLLEEAQAAIERTNERWFEAEVWRLKGEVLLQRDEESAALSKVHFTQALTVARVQGGRLWELRAALQLAQDAHAAAGVREQLAVIRSGFPEELSLPELKAADRLLIAAEAVDDLLAVRPGGGKRHGKTI
ncbi:MULTISPECIES: adenylate/guanylate cyclase domain-containing protein [unclassified Sinorhizobium]|uniref:ATP-binding protein n=1 Tax=unclassified Sinorhizobium TaxID=2613772 RepID=UPI003525D71B